MRELAAARTVAAARTLAAARLTASARLTANSIRNLPGLVEWWSAAQSVQTQVSDGTGGAPGNGDPVGRVTGLVGGRHLIQATAGSRFTFQSAGPTGTPAWALDGTADFMHCDGLAATFSGTSLPITVIVTARLSSLAASRAVFSLGNSGLTNPFVLCRMSSAFAWQQARRGTTGSGKPPSNLAAPAAVASSVVLGFRCNGLTGDLWQNGSLAAAAIDQDVGAMAVNELTVGCSRLTTNTAFWVGDIMDVVIITTPPSDVQMYQVMRYFGTQDQVY